jgi:hypothetical protein
VTAIVRFKLTNITQGLNSLPENLGGSPFARPVGSRGILVPMNGNETFNDHVLTPGDYGTEDVHGSLTGLEVPTEHARYFGHRLGTGTEGAVLTVKADECEAEAILLSYANFFPYNGLLAHRGALFAKGNADFF